MIHYLRLIKEQVFYSIAVNGPDCAPVPVLGHPNRWEDRVLPAGTVLTAGRRDMIKWMDVRSLADPGWGARWIYTSEVKELSPLEALAAAAM